MRTLNRQHLPWIMAISVLTLSLIGCGNPSNEVLSPTKKSNTLTVITKPSLNTYHEGKNGQDGMEFQLIKQFAGQYKYELNIILVKKEDDIYQALDSGLADVALVGKPMSISKQDSYLQTQAYMDVTSQLIYRHNTGKPESFEDLTGKRILVQDNEQNREKYQFLKAQYPDLEWEFSQRPFEELMGLVNTGLIDAAVINSHDYLSKRSLYTRTRIAFDLYYPEPISFALSKHTDASMRNSLDLFFDQAKEDGTIASLVERYYGHADDFNPRGSMSFFYQVRTRLPNYQDTIERIAREYNLDWRLLAAIAYQESHWDPHAKSPTGVRGMMMLTQGTAKDMGVKNRLDIEESLRGGAKYFKKVRRRLPQSIKEPDRTWFALAAYNVGLGHVIDARNITAFHDGNPDKWADVKEHLPLLEKKDWYQFTEHGYARGSEPVGYVQNIRHINSLLEWRFPLKNKNRNSKNSLLSVKGLDQAIKEAKTKTTTKKKPIKLSRLFL